MRWLALGILWAVVIACGGGPEGSEPVARPVRLTATTNDSRFVRLDWGLDPGAAPSRLIVLRDGELIADLPPHARDFQDFDAAPARPAVERFQGEPGEVGVDLAWDVAPGQTSHRYVVRAYEGEHRFLDSSPVEGARAPPQVEKFSILRDGEVVAEVGAAARSFHDAQVGRGPTPHPRTSATSAAVLIEWDQPSGGQGQTHGYEIRGNWLGGVESSAGPIEVEAAPGKVEGFVVYRDGTAVSTLSPAARSFTDAGAAPGRGTSPQLVVVSETVGTVELQWGELPSIPGKAHSYELALLWKGGGEIRSEPVMEQRAAPAFEGVQVWRDGTRIAELPADTRAFADDGAQAGSISPSFLGATGREDGVALAWTVTGGVRGQRHRYQLRSVAEMGGPGLSNEVEGSRSEPGILGFEIARDGIVVATLDAEQRQWLDEEAGPATTFGAALLMAQTHAEGVSLSWTRPTSQGTTHRYEVRVVSEYGPGAPADATGARIPIPSSFELQRDEGPWIPVSAARLGSDRYGFVDRESPRGTIHIDASVASHPVVWGTSLKSTIREVIPPEPSVYRIRAVEGEVVGAPSTVAWGSRAVGTSYTYQWQHSETGAEGDWGDLPDQRSAQGFDERVDSAPRFYRVRVSSAGADGVSAAVAGEVDTFEQIAAFNQFNCGIRTSDGKRRCWGGANAFGEAPTALSEDAFDHIALGESFGCGIRRGDGKRICWGNDSFGQAPPEPSDVAFRHLDASYGYACGVRADGKLECWGHMQFGQNPPASLTDSFVQVSTGMYHVCAIRESDHKVLCWGSDEVRAPPGPSEDAFLQISSGKQFTCGVRLGDHKVLCWGNGLYGEAPPGPSANAYASVAAGDMHTCGVRLEDGLVECWGMNDNCESFVGQVSLHPFLQVVGGFNHSCGILEDGERVVCWGLNVAGQAPRHMDVFPRTCRPLGG